MTNMGSASTYARQAVKLGFDMRCDGPEPSGMPLELLSVKYYK